MAWKLVRALKAHKTRGNDLADHSRELDIKRDFSRSLCCQASHDVLNINVASKRKAAPTRPGDRACPSGRPFAASERLLATVEGRVRR